MVLCLLYSFLFGKAMTTAANIGLWHCADDATSIQGSFSFPGEDTQQPHLIDATK